MDRVGEEAVATRAGEQRAHGAAGEPANEGEGPGQLVRTALDDLRKLVTLEVALARQELGVQLALARVAIIALAAGGALLLMSLTLFAVTIALATSNPPLVALLMGAGLLVLAVSAGALGWSKLPKAPMAATRGRLEFDIERLRHFRS